MTDRPTLPSLIDRLSRSAGGRVSSPVGPEDVREAVVRDLEWLLNSRRLPVKLPAPLDESLLAFGLPDFSTASLDRPWVRERLADALADAIRRFEPRLLEVRVSVDDALRPDLRLRFRIVAWLRVEPEPQEFLADTLLDLATRELVMEQGRTP